MDSLYYLFLFFLAFALAMVTVSLLFARANAQVQKKQKASDEVQIKKEVVSLFGVGDVYDDSLRHKDYGSNSHPWK